jgi:methylglutaconyl-CoA hydratase
MSEPTSQTTPQEVGYGISGATATITLDIPATRNALSTSVLAQLRRRLAEAVADDAVRVVVVSHTGPVFSSGMDLRTVVDVPAEDQPVMAFPALLADMVTAPKPVIARVAGKARAGGIGLLAACDIAVGTSDADFAFTEVHLGLIPASISLSVLRRVSEQAARRLFLTGETFDAQYAASIGLLDRVVAPDTLDEEVRAVATSLTEGGPGALAAIKRLLADPPGGTLAERYQALAALSARHFASPEGQEGTAARREKRRPTWAP